MPRHLLRAISGMSVGLFLASQAPLLAQLTIDPDLIIDLPEVNLSADAAGQTFSIYIQNTSAAVAVNGIGLNLQVADGGPAAGGAVAGPAITAVDIFTGTIFEAPNNNGVGGSGSIVPQVYEVGTLTPSGTVSLGSGVSKVATVTVTTANFFAGTYSLTLDTLNGRSKYTTLSGDLFPTLVLGSITVVPEPRECALAIGLGLAAFAFCLRMRGFGSNPRRSGDSVSR